MATEPPIYTFNDALAVAGLVGSKTPEEEFITSTGPTPLEFLAEVYRSPLHDPKDRINAAKAILEYTHRKLPTKAETNVNLSGPKLNPAMLQGLTDSELETLIKLLEKADAAAR